MRRQAPTRRPRHRFPAARRRRLRWRSQLFVAGIALAVVILAWAALARQFAPKSNTSRTRFDAIIVLGTPADSDGNPTPSQLARVNEGVREYERDVAPRILFTGGAAHNRFVEAYVMAQAAESQGIPPSVILQETEAKDTIENACYAVRIMKEHGWGSAEVVSSASHLPRAGLIFSHMPIEWRTHAAPPMEPESWSGQEMTTALETLKTARYLVYADWAERCQP